MIVNEFQDCELLIDEKLLRKVQARWRGAVVRNWLKKVRSHYLEIFHKVEETTSCDVCWQHSSVVSRPQFVAIAKRCQMQASILVENPPSAIDDLQLNDKTDDSRCRSIAVGPDENNEAAEVHFWVQHLGSSDVVSAESPAIVQQNTSNESEALLLKSTMCNYAPLERFSVDEPSSVSTHSDCDEHDVIVTPSLAAGEHSSVPDHESVRQDMTTSPPPPCDRLVASETKDGSVCDDAPLVGSSLQEQRHNLALELLWVQQAIHSRKQYLRLKRRISERDNG
jgi:hypothetical protein